MIHHERLRPPSHDYPADEWNIIEKAFHPEFLAQLETMLALGNGYLGMRGCPEEGGPNAENGTLINGFYETRPIVYGEEAYGFAKTGQTIFNVTDSKIIKLFVDDEPFWLPNANLLELRPAAQHEVRDARPGDPLGDAGRQTGADHIPAFGLFRASARGRHLLSCDAPQRGGPRRDLFGDGGAMQPSARANADDPRQARVFAGRVLHHRASYAKDRRIVLCHATEKSRLTLTCATDHALETACPHAYKAVHTEDFGQVAFTIEARPGCPIHLTKYMVYHTSQTASAEELCGRAEWTMDRVMTPGVPAAARLPRAVHGRFLAPQRCPGQGYQGRPHEAHHRGDPASDPLQPLSHPAGLGARGRRGRAGEGPHRTSV